MLKHRTVLLLAAVMALGAAFVVPSICAERGVEVCAIACLAEQRCEQQEIGRRLIARVEYGPSPVSFIYEPPQTNRFEWPASFQRPPTRTPFL